MTRLMTWRMTSAWPSQQTTVMALTWLLTSPVDPTLDPTRPDQRVNPVNGSTRSTGRPGQRVDPVNGSTRSTSLTRSTVNRVNPVKPDPVNTLRPCARAATRAEPSGGACGRVRGLFWAILVPTDSYRNSLQCGI